jgi:hypothetical protein
LPVLPDRRFQKQGRRDPAAGIRFGVFFLERDCDRIQIGVGLFEGYTVLQPAERSEARVVVAQKHAGLRANVTEWDVDFGPARQGHAHYGLEDTDYFIRHSIDEQVLS